MVWTLRLLVADPTSRTVETSSGTWVVAGVDAASIAWFIRKADSRAEIKQRLPSIAEDAIVINVDDDSGRTVHAYRSIAGSHRLYFTTLPSGEFVVTDHFRNALAMCPLDRRTVPAKTKVDHLLFRAPVGATGFVEEIGGVGQGMWCTWHLDDGTSSSTQLDTIGSDREIAPADAPRAIGETYDDLIDASAFDGDLINLYSGGVDSTLTQTFLRGTKMLNVGVDSPEYAYEVEYAREGADHFRSPLKQEMLEETNLLEHIESSIEATASPSCPFQTPLINEAFSQYTGRQFVMSVGADSIFGNVPLRGPRYADWCSPVLNKWPSRWLFRLSPSRVSRFVSWLETLDQQLDRAPSDPESYAHQYATYANPDYAASLFDADIVDERIRAQTGYVADRVQIDPSNSRFARQAEWRHMNLVYGHRVGSRWRQLAMAHGNSVINPFETRSMIETSVSVPAEKRFVSGRERCYNVSTKHLLKKLLRKRLPGYPIGQPKGAGVLPYERYRADGPLSSAFEQYKPPSFVPAENRDEILSESGRQSWNLLTYAIWRDRVLQNDDLDLLDTTTEYTWRVPGAEIAASF